MTVRSFPLFLSQVDVDVIKIDIQCLVEGDVVLECVHLDLDPDREIMMFRIMFNTGFIRSNILMLGSDELDMLWDSKYRYPKNFRAEVSFVLFMNALFMERNSTTCSCNLFPLKWSSGSGSVW